MAYDEALAERIRERLAADDDVKDMKMFDGLALLVGGHMAATASQTARTVARRPSRPGATVVGRSGLQAPLLRQLGVDLGIRLGSDRFELGEEGVTLATGEVLADGRLQRVDLTVDVDPGLT